jgi:hypothetical protein
MTTKTFTSSHQNRLINPLSQNPDFDLYLKSLKTCLRNQIDISPLQQWWSANCHLIRSNNVLIDFSTLLDEITITGNFKAQTSAAPTSQRQSNTQPKKRKQNLPLFFPWTDLIFKTSELGDRTTHELLADYSGYLTRYYLGSVRLPSRGPRHSLGMVVTTGTIEHEHLVEISDWVANKSGIENCHFVFETILKARDELVLYSDDVFKAATKCPHRLFRLFMISDLTGFNFENGKTLLSLLSLPVGSFFTPCEEACISPYYPFFDNDLFKNIHFNTDSTTLAHLNTAWATFYEQWDCVTRENNGASSSGDLFALTLGSLTGCNTTVPISDLINILDTIKPNIWCVQFWLHQVVLGEGSPALNAAKIEKLSGTGAAPDFVEYFFVVADYVYKQGQSDLSSCILAVGILLLVYWADKNPGIIEDCLSKYFTVIFNHRRTTYFRKYTGHLIRMQVLCLDPIQWGNLGLRLDVIINDYSLADIHAVGQSTNSITPDCPCWVTVTVNHGITPSSTKQNLFDDVLKVMVAAMNSNGGDITIGLPRSPNKPIKRMFTKLQQMIAQFIDSAKTQGFDCIEAKLDERIPELWVRIYRSSYPVYLNIQGFSGLWVMIKQPFELGAFYGTEATNILVKRFTMLDKSHSIVLTCDTD